MKTIIKLYLKAFFLISIPYFVILLGLDLIDSSELNIWNYLLKSIFFGLFMSLILVSMHLYKLKKEGVENITDDNVGVNQTRYIETKLNINELIQKFKLDPLIAKMKMTEIENGFLLKTGMTMKSWGEEIKIIFKSNRGDFHEYQVSSKPILKTTIVDYGKNLENIKIIESLIKNIA